MYFIKRNSAAKRRHFIKSIATTAGVLTAFPGLLAAMREHEKTWHEDGQNFTFLFQGDSITDGNRSRNSDWNHVMGHGYAYLISSRLWYDHPKKAFHFLNRGISGNKVTDLAARWQADTIDLHPSLLSILVGVNDVNNAIDQHETGAAAKFEEQYRSLLQQTKERLPGTKLVLCEPFLLPVGKVKDNWQVWSDEMKSRQQSVKQLAIEFNAIHVLLQDDFNKACEKAPADYWIWDGIHPMPAGHEMIARKWIKTVSGELRFIRE